MKKINVATMLICMCLLSFSSGNASADYTPPAPNPYYDSATEYVCYWTSTTGDVLSMVYKKTDYDSQLSSLGSGAFDFHPDYGPKIGQSGNGSRIAIGGSYDTYYYTSGTWHYGNTDFPNWPETINNANSLQSQIACSADLYTSYPGFSFQGQYYSYPSIIMPANYSPPAAFFKLPDTGQTKCYQSVNPYGEIPCEGTGQDGAYIINPMSFTVIGTNSDMVQDNNTGLIWQKEGDGAPRTWAAADSYCASLGAGWRLPMKKELTSIVDYSVPNPGPTINSSYFPNTIESYYWSSATDAFGPDAAWIVAFYNGGSVGGYTGNAYFVRCVRGGESAPSLTDNGNGTVTDTNTDLMWQQGEAGYMTWQEALNYCESLTLPSEGYSDWRLPNIKELESISDDTLYDPVNHPIAIDTVAFPNAIASNVYWSSTTYAGSTHLAWYVGIGNGGINAGNRKDDVLYVRCVRGGNVSPQPCTYTYSDWGACQPDNTQTRKVSTATPDGCTGTPVLSQSCVYVPPAPKLDVSPSSLQDFGILAVGLWSAPKEFTISNNGDAILSVYSINLSDTTDYVLEGTGNVFPGDCVISQPIGAILSPHGSCTFAVKFHPQTVGPHNEYFTISSNDTTKSGYVPLSGTGINEHWVYPVVPYLPGSYANRTFFYNQDHLGEDESQPEGTPIRALGQGTVVFYGKATGYGELVAVVEHDLGKEYGFINAYGELVTTRYILSIYGHLRECADRSGTLNCTGLKKGKSSTTKDTIIGYVNNSSHPDGLKNDPNGDGLEHLHLGIRLSDARTAQEKDPKWFRGYENATGFGKDFAAASRVILILRGE